jgi:dihydropteroate synthase
MKGNPHNMQEDPHYEDLIAEIHSFLEASIDRAVAAGVERSNIIIDPGIGFGKTAQDNVKLIRNLDKFADLKVPILIGTSRKSFIGKLLGLEVNERLEATLASLAISVEKGAHILRVHDVQPAKRFLDALSLFTN